jgi:hypothetical protein
MVTSLGRSWLLSVILAICATYSGTHIVIYVLHMPHQRRNFLLTVLHLLTFLLPFLVILLLVLSSNWIFIANYELLSTSLRLYMFLVVLFSVCFL